MTDLPTNADIATQLRQIANAMRERTEDADDTDREIDQINGAMFDLAADQVEHGQVDGDHHKDLLGWFVKLGVIAYNIDQAGHPAQPEAGGP